MVFLEVMHFTYENVWSLLSALFFYGLLISTVNINININININNLQEFLTIRCVML